MKMILLIVIAVMITRLADYLLPIDLTQFVQAEAWIIGVYFGFVLGAYVGEGWGKNS